MPEYTIIEETDAQDIAEIESIDSMIKYLSFIGLKPYEVSMLKDTAVETQYVTGGSKEREITVNTFIPYNGQPGLEFVLLSDDENPTERSKDDIFYKTNIPRLDLFEGVFNLIVRDEYTNYLNNEFNFAEIADVLKKIAKGNYDTSQLPELEVIAEETEVTPINEEVPPKETPVVRTRVIPIIPVIVGEGNYMPGTLTELNQHAKEHLPAQSNIKDAKTYLGNTIEKYAKLKKPTEDQIRQHEFLKLINKYYLHLQSSEKAPEPELTINNKDVSEQVYTFIEEHLPL